MELFAYKVTFDKDDDYDPVNGKSRSYNFNTFYEGFTTVFLLITFESWTSIFMDHYRTVGKAVTSVYFLSFLMVGPILLLNLFLAILLKNFDEEPEDDEV